MEAYPLIHGLSIQRPAEYIFRVGRDGWRAPVVGFYCLVQEEHADRNRQQRRKDLDSFEPRRLLVPALLLLSPRQTDVICGHLAHCARSGLGTDDEGPTTARKQPRQEVAVTFPV